MMRPALALALFLLPLTVFAQKRPLDHDAYERWRAIEDVSLSHDGEWAAWREAPDTIGDADVIVRRTDGSALHVISRGDSARFTPDGRRLVALVRPPYDATRAAKMDGKEGDDLPKDSLAVLDLASGGVSMLGPVKSFAVAEDAGDVLAILFDVEKPDNTADDSSAAGEPDPEDKTDSSDVDHEKKNGTRLVVRHLTSGREWSFDSVVEYAVSDDGAWVVYAAESRDGEADGAFAVRTSTGEATAMKTGEGHYRQLSLDDDGSQAAFVANPDSFASKQPAFFLYRAVLGEEARAVAMEGMPGIPEGWWVSEHAGLDFSDSGDRLFFGTAPRPEPEEEDQRPEEEKVVLDVWNWTDPLLQPMQLVRLDDELKRSYTAIVNRRGRIVQLGTLEIPAIDPLESGDAPVVIGSSDLPYRQEVSWDSPGYSDFYVIDAETGEGRKVLAGIRYGVYASPYGAHLAWWDPYGLAWKITSAATGQTVDITSRADLRFDDLLHDWPHVPGPAHRPAGWTTDGRAFLLYDEFDLWIASPDGRLLSNMTDGAGRRENVRYRYVELDSEAKGIDLSKPLFLSAFDRATKADGFARLEMGGEGPTRLFTADQSLGEPLKAKRADRLLFTRESFSEFGDLWTSDLDLGSLERLSDANPQQAEYLWGSGELVHWTSLDGDRIEGLLYKPEGFDPSVRYPLIVYFYEKNADGLHRYHPVNPHRSVVRPSFYTSRGYVFFVPDIPYKIGYPGESAMNAVMPGVTRLIDQGIADPDRVGVQGHSWGGYQVAYLVTRTNLFAAAAAGAPVANMTSAYGGIRWESGMSRMFQYERTQSRIGGSLWDKPLRYIENSPVFWADKIQTPLLMLHNDHDGAVPWYQGIEMFTALRRLGKPTWLVNYNDEPHWPLPYWKRLDWNVRMQQFFDHFLKGEPPAEWIVRGIPAVMKGRTMGLDPVEEQ